MGDHFRSWIWILFPRGSILTPHKGEFEILKSKIKNQKSKAKFKSSKLEEQVSEFAKEYNCVVLVKGEKDIVCSSAGGCVEIPGGNAGMTKGGDGDVLVDSLRLFIAKMTHSYLPVQVLISTKKQGKACIKGSDPILTPQILLTKFQK